MHYNPLVSIIIPVYNGGNYMREAIDSAINQTYKNIEIIVVNDGSPDNGETERIALSYGDKIRYYRKENGGCASALNYGIELMQGEWFSWLSHDDVYFTEKIEKQIACIVDNKLDADNTIISAEAKIIDGNGNEIIHPTASDVGFYDSEDFVGRLLFKSALNGCGLLIPKKVIDKVGLFSTELKYLLDWEYWLRSAISGANLYRMGNNKLVMNRVHPKQVTVSHSERYPAEIKSVIQKLLEKSEDYSIPIKKSLYLYSVARSQGDIQIQLEQSLKDCGALDFKLKIKGKIIKLRKMSRKTAAKLYWILVRSIKK